MQVNAGNIKKIPQLVRVEQISERKHFVHTLDSCNALRWADKLLFIKPGPGIRWEEQALSVAGPPQLNNFLPPHITLDPSLACFKSQITTHVLACDFNTLVVDSVCLYLGTIMHSRCRETEDRVFETSGIARIKVQQTKRDKKKRWTCSTLILTVLSISSITHIHKHLHTHFSCDWQPADSGWMLSGRMLISWASALNTNC